MSNTQVELLSAVYVSFLHEELVKRKKGGKTKWKQLFWTHEYLHEIIQPSYGSITQGYFELVLLDHSSFFLKIS